MANTRDTFDKVIKAFNAHDRDTLSDLTADSCIVSAPGGQQARGRKESVELTTAWIDAFPDAHLDVGQVHVDGDVVIEEGAFVGTHKGVFRTPTGDIPATQRKVHGDYIAVNEFRNGKLVRQNLMFDRQQLMEQLGLAPTLAAAARR